VFVGRLGSCWRLGEVVCARSFGGSGVLCWSLAVVCFWSLSCMIRGFLPLRVVGCSLGYWGVCGFGLGWCFCFDGGCWFVVLGIMLRGLA